jgi:hypothetical protein
VKQSILSAAFFFVALSFIRADLKWSNPQQEFTRAPEDGQIIAKFEFQNVGRSPVEITRIATSCGCTTSKLEKKTYAPGESGTVEVTFTFGDRLGEQRKTISVSTNDGRQCILELLCRIEDYLTVKPTLVFWRTGEPATPKSIELSANSSYKITVTGVKSSNPRITATVETAEAGRKYIVDVVPADTTQKESAQLTIQTDFPRDSPKRFTAYARVK